MYNVQQALASAFLSCHNYLVGGCRRIAQDFVEKVEDWELEKQGVHFQVNGYAV